MADDVPITPGSGAVVATDDVGGKHYQKIKVDLGGDGASSPLVRGQQTKANALPVTMASDQEVLAPITGKVKDDSGDDCTVKPARIDQTFTSGQVVTLVANVASKKIRVFAVHIASMQSNDAKVSIRENDDSPIYWRAAVLAQDTQALAVAAPLFLFETTAGQGLEVVNDTAASRDLFVSIVYAEVD